MVKHVYDFLTVNKKFNYDLEKSYILIIYKIINCNDVNIFNIYKKTILSEYKNFENISHHKNILDFIFGKCILLNNKELILLNKIYLLNITEEFLFYDFIKIYLNKINKT